MSNTLSTFTAQVLAAAKAAGIEQAEIYSSGSSSFRVMTVGGQISDYAVSDVLGISLRGIYEGRMGYASTQAMDEAAVEQLVQGVKENAAMLESDAKESIYPGDKDYAKMDTFSNALAEVSAEKKIDFALQMEAAVAEFDPRLTCDDAIIGSSQGQIRIENSYGLALEHRDNSVYAALSVAAREGDKVASSWVERITRDFDALSVEDMVREVGSYALDMLHAEPAPSGEHAVVIDSEAMVSLMDAFSGIFSAERAQEGLSLLDGREGETIAAQCVSLMDDPLLPGGLSSCPFDAEGVASRRKAVIENGVLKTLLHNRKTAEKAGVASTGNAAKGSYAGAVHVAPTNFYFAAGEVPKETLFAQMGDGLYITAVSGLHAGTNAVSGDFSLLAEGYMIRGGKRCEAINQSTVAGNFFTLLQDIVALGNDLKFPLGGIGSPSVWVKKLSVAGK